MPFKSRAQQRFFFSAESRGELPKGTALRWAHETPNIKALPDKKKEQTKKADYSVLRQGLIKGASLPHLKNANSFLGTLSDARNALFGENNLGRLDSWNNVKGYLPKSVSGYVDKNYVNPAINKQINETVGNAWKSLAAAGAATGSGLLGLYWLYNGLKRPKPPVREEVKDPVKFMAPSVKPLRTVNENLGLDASGRSLLKLSAYVRKDPPGLKVVGSFKVGGWVRPAKTADERERGWLGAARDNALALGAGSVTGSAGGLAANLGLGAFHTDKTLNSNYRHQKIIRDWLKPKNITPNFITEAPKNRVEKLFHGFTTGGAYAVPGNMGSAIGVPSNTIFSARKTPAALYHEAGHLANYNSIQSRLASKYGPEKAHKLTESFYKLTRPGKGFTTIPSAASKGSLGLALAAPLFADKDSPLATASMLAPWVGAAPMIAEEGIASVRGLNALRRVDGLAAALRRVPRLGGALASYASLPAGISLSAYLMNRWRPDNR